MQLVIEATTITRIEMPKCLRMVCEDGLLAGELSVAFRRQSMATPSLPGEKAAGKVCIACQSPRVPYVRHAS